MPSFISYSSFSWILFTIQLWFLLLMRCLSSSSPSIPIPFFHLVISLLSKLIPDVVNTLLYNALSFLLLTATLSYFTRFFLILLSYSPLYYFSPHFHCFNRRLYSDITSSFPISYSFSLFSDVNISLLEHDEIGSIAFIDVMESFPSFLDLLRFFPSFPLLPSFLPLSSPLTSFQISSQLLHFNLPHSHLHPHPLHCPATALEGRSWSLACSAPLR